MAPAAKRGRRGTTKRQPLCATPAAPEQTQIQPNLEEIFNNSQHVASSDLALNQLKKLYKNTEFSTFEGPFRNCVKKLLQSKQQSIYFRTSCDVLCKFLQHVSKLSDDLKTKQGAETTVENADPSLIGRRVTRSSFGSVSSSVNIPKQPTNKRGRKRKPSSSDEDDELLGGYKTKGNEVSMQTESTTEDDSIILETTSRRKSALIVIAPITDHDRVISSCIDVADHYMQLQHEEYRLNGVYFLWRFLSHVESLDEEICSALKSTLPRRIRDKKSAVRAYAVLASKTFQYDKLIQEAFEHHFYRDPELNVRKALIQVMDPKVFRYDFLCDATQDANEGMKKTAFVRLGKLSPLDLSQTQLQLVIHNGFNERERLVAHTFKQFTLEPWLKDHLYDGNDLYKMLCSFDVINNYDDVCRLLNFIYERDLDKLENNGASTKLHHVVESFRERWLSAEDTCPDLGKIDAKVVTIWLTLIKFCKTNHAIIKPVKIRQFQRQTEAANDSIEKLLDSQQQNDEVAELYERIAPDLVNLVDFLASFINHAEKTIKANENEATTLEFIYQQIMEFLATHEISDEMERKTVQEVLSTILKENLLTGKFNEFIQPILKSLFKLIYHSSSGLMINYISELIHNVRSHLEDLISSTRPQQCTALTQSTIAAPTSSDFQKSTKKAKTESQTKSTRKSVYVFDPQNIELKIADIRIEIEELNDAYDEAMKVKDFDQAKLLHNKISDRKAELVILHDRRCSIASDVSNMSMVIETEPAGGSKFSSTMIGDSSMNESTSSEQDKNENKLVFRHHRNELLKCLQMYFGCLQNVKTTQVPPTMLAHLQHLTYECQQEPFKNDTRIMCLAVACVGLTALVDEEFAKTEFQTRALTHRACYGLTNPLELKTVGFKCLVDVLCQHSELESDINKLEGFLKVSLRNYGKYDYRNIKKNELDFISALVEGTTKLFYFRKLSSPEVLAHLIIWWYHPYTHPRLKQFIGIFLPSLVVSGSKGQELAFTDENDTWLEDLLGETFIVSIEYLHAYILCLNEGYNIMSKGDMHNLISFLCNLVPVAYHSSVQAKVEEKIDNLGANHGDLLKFLKLSKNSLTSTNSKNNDQAAAD